MNPVSSNASDIVQLREEVENIKTELQALKEGMKGMYEVISRTSQIAERALNKTENHTHDVKLDKFNIEKTSGPHFRYY